MIPGGRTGVQLKNMIKNYKRSEDQIMEYKILIGDEVQCYNDYGEPMLGIRFIATDIGRNYLAGIDFGGEIYYFGSDLSSLKKTGRHYDILGALLKLRDQNNK